MALLGHCFCEEIGRLMFRRYTMKFDHPSRNMLANIVAINFNMSGALMEHSVFSNANRTCVFCIEWSWASMKFSKHCKCQSQIISLLADDMLMKSGLLVLIIRILM